MKRNTVSALTLLMLLIGVAAFIVSYGRAFSEISQTLKPTQSDKDNFVSTSDVDDATSILSIPPPIQWEKTYGEAGSDNCWSSIETKDRGYALAGSTDSFGAGGRDFWLVKTNAKGNMLWNRSFGGPTFDVAYSVVETRDEGYALGGTTDSFGAGGRDFWLVKTNAKGNPLWDKTYGGRSDDWAWDVVETRDGGYAIAGYTESFGDGFKDFWLVKTDASGNVLWNKTYGGPYDDVARSVVETSEGGYAIAGHTVSFGVGYGDFWLVKTDANGNVLWNHTYGGLSDEVARSVIETRDGGYALAGYTRSFGAGDEDFWFVKTNASGNMVWNKTYGGPNQEGARSVIETRDGGYALAGYKNITWGAEANRDFWLIKTDASGNTLWNDTYGGPNQEGARSVVETRDGGYAIAGYTNSFGAGEWDVWLLKLAARAIEHAYAFSLVPNALWNTSSSLSDDVFGSTTGTGYLDKFAMTLTSTTHVRIQLKGRATGDTIALVKSRTKYWNATAPNGITLDGNLEPGLYTFYVTFILPNNGMFPAGYDIYVKGLRVR